MTPVTFFVPGVPMPKGSGHTHVKPDGRTVYLETGDRPTKTRARGALKSWQKAVGQVAGMYWRGDLLDGPVFVRLDFTLPTSSGAPWMQGTGDVDKLARAVLDGLEKVIYQNDARVTRLVVNKKTGEQAGVTVTVGQED